MTLRPYQKTIKSEIIEAWNQGIPNVLAVLPTGAGKTVVFSDIIKDHDGASCVIAHRQELVSQSSLALARDGVRHRIIGPIKVIRLCVRIHMEELGVAYVDPNARCAVAGVDTLKSPKRLKALAVWLQSVTLVVQDEAHHLLRANKWGKVLEHFPNAKLLGVTATPERADGKGLGREYDGVFDQMIVGPNMADLMEMGFLSKYRAFAPPSDLNLSEVNVSKKTGEYNPDGLKIAVRKSHVVGDVVDHYKRVAMGKLGVTFATDVETATDITAKFNAAGVPAKLVHAGTPDGERVSILRDFKNKKILQVVNVDLFGEGLDLPAIEVVSMARPTQSYGLYIQQFGRGLRLLEGKTHAIILDHVGNIARHGLPDRPRTWSLERRAKRDNGGGCMIPVKACPMCAGVYERLFKSCPYCGHVAEPISRSSIEFVDGDLYELMPETLAQMRGEVDYASRPAADARREAMSRGIPEPGWAAASARQRKKLETLDKLKNAMSWWAGYKVAEGRSESENFRLFYFTYGVDVLTAQTLKNNEMIELNNRIVEDIKVCQSA